ncbi:MAG: type II toxin-antitoxin system prevent-host-death family antitoxin [Deltaproteobacteria bacterium]|jgi:prevent-host-death family protein
MKTAAVSVLKASLSEYLSCVKAGEEILITDRGKPIAKIVPLERNGSLITDELINLERAGMARIGSKEIPDAFWTSVRPSDEKGMLLKALLQEREEER